MKFLYPILFLAAFSLGACDKKNELDLPKMGSGDVSKEAGDLKDALASTAAKERADFMARVDQERAELNTRIEALKKDAAQATGSAKAELDAQLAKLEAEQKVADQTMVEMRSAMGEQWDALKIALNESFERLKRSLDVIKSGA